MSKITIDVKSRKPIFEQLRDNIRTLALSGVLSPDEQLPSIRSLACELAINPNTIQKAYPVLERDGIIYSLPARGSFVSADLGGIRTAEREALLSVIAAKLHSAATMGVKRSEIEQILDKEWRENS